MTTMLERGPTVAALILAAGQGTRFAARSGGAAKLLAFYRGVPLVRHAAVAALGSAAKPVFLVTGHEGARVKAALADLPLHVVDNPAFAQGMATSLVAGVGALPPSVDGVLVLLGDMPGVTAALLDLLTDAFTAHPHARAIVPTFGGRRGNPVLLARKMFAAVLELTGDEGARRVLGNAADLIEVAVNDAGVALDVDTPEMLSRSS